MTRPVRQKRRRAALAPTPSARPTLIRARSAIGWDGVIGCFAPANLAKLLTALAISDRCERGGR